MTETEFIEWLPKVKVEVLESPDIELGTLHSVSQNMANMVNASNVVASLFMSIRGVSELASGYVSRSHAGIMQRTADGVYVDGIRYVAIGTARALHQLDAPVSASVELNFLDNLGLYPPGMGDRVFFMKENAIVLLHESSKPPMHQERSVQTAVPWYSCLTRVSVLFDNEGAYSIKP